MARKVSRPTSKTFLWLALCGWAVGVCAGCSGRSQADAKVYADAAQAYEEATKAYEAGRYSEAQAAFSAALKAGGLLPDQLGNALIWRAECFAREGKFAEAHADLDRAARGAPMDLVHATRSFVYAKEGNQGKSDEEWREAKKSNSAIQRIRE